MDLLHSQAKKKNGELLKKLILQPNLHTVILIILVPTVVLTYPSTNMENVACKKN